MSKNKGDNEEIISRYYWISLFAIVFLGGIILFLSLYLDPKSANLFWGIIKNIGITFIGSGILSFLMKFITGIADKAKLLSLKDVCKAEIGDFIAKEYRVIKRMDELGIVDMFETREKSYTENPEFGKWDNLFRYHNQDPRAFRNVINIIGINLDGIFKSERLPDDFNVDILVDRAKLKDYPRIDALICEIEKGATVSIVVPMVNSSFLKDRAKTENTQAPESWWPTRILLNTRILLKIKSLLVPEYRDKLMLYAYPHNMYYFMLQSRDLLYVTNYLGHAPGNNCPSAVYRYAKDSSCIFNHYTEDFSSIVQKSTEIKPTDDSIKPIKAP